MKISIDRTESILGVDVRVKSKSYIDNMNDYSSGLILHKQINGDEVYVPLETNKMWPHYR